MSLMPPDTADNVSEHLLPETPLRESPVPLETPQEKWLERRVRKALPTDVQTKAMTA